MFSYVSLEQRVPADHPLRAVRKLKDAVLGTLSPEFVARRLFAEVKKQAKEFMSDEHFTVDGTLIQGQGLAEEFSRHSRSACVTIAAANQQHCGRRQGV
jgi:hypothetical protein